MVRFRIAVVVFAVIATASAPSWADGIIVYRALDQDIREPQQKAFIVHADGVQDLVLSVVYEGAASDFGWLVPLPARPEMEPAEGPVFETLSIMMQQPFAVGHHLAPETLGGGGVAGVQATFHDVGIYDVALLDGTDGSALQAWLETHEFVLPAGAVEVLDEYSRKRWTIAAIRIDPEQMGEATEDNLSSGVIQPILFRFPAEEPVFPLRISSLGGHHSEVLLYLLAERPLRPVQSTGVAWQVALQPWVRAARHIPESYWADPDYDPTVFNMPEPAPWYLRDVYGRFYEQKDALWLTKCRATLAPEHMVDLSFEEHDAIAALSSDDATMRVEAIGYLATREDAHAVDALVDFLARREFPQDTCNEDAEELRDWPWPEQDIRSAAWALGQLGDPRAIPELVRWAMCDRPMYQVDALDGLHRLDAGMACEIAMEIIEHGDRVSKRDHCARILYQAAVKTVIGDGGPELEERGRRLVDRRVDPNPVEQVVDRIARHRSPFDLDLRADAMAIAASIGNGVGTEILLRELVADATTWCVGLAHGDTVSGAGGTNHYPGSLRPLTAYAALHELRGVTDEGRDAFVALKKLAGRPAVRDQLLRRLGSIDSLSVFARALFYGELSHATDADIAAVRELWETARCRPRWVFVEFPGRGSGRLCSFTDVFDLDACAIAHAMSCLARFETLLDWWHEVPWTDPYLKGEMLAAMAMARSSEAKPEALYDATVAYMRHVWNDRIGELDREDCFDPEYQWPIGYWPYQNAFDNDFRQRAIELVFGSKQRARSAQLIDDTTLDPAIRLFWLQKTWYWLGRGDPDRLQRILRELGPLLDDPTLQRSIRQLEERIAQLDARGWPRPEIRRVR